MSDTTTAWILIVAAIGPGLLLLGSLNTAQLRPFRSGRPWGPIWIAFMLGVVAAYPACWLEWGLSPDGDPWRFNNLGAFLMFWIIVAGVVEECCKFAMFHVAAACTPWYHEEYDGIVLAAAVALGFATIENLLYVRQYGLEVARLRAFTAVPAHAMFGVIMGASLGMARCRARWKWSDMGLPLSGLALAIVAHGLYDAVASSSASGNRAALSVFALVLVGLAVVTLRLCRAARRSSPAFGGRRISLPPPHGSLHLPPLPQRRDAATAAVLGLVPGLGQAYNGEVPKALLFFSVGCVNLGLYWIAHTFATAPSSAIALLQNLGLAIVVTPAQLTQAVQQKWMLEPVLMVLVIVWELLGAADAWYSARRRWARQQTHAVRRSFASYGLGMSYMAHLLVIFLLVMAPVIDEACGGKPEAPDPPSTGTDGSADAASHAWRLTRVTAPQHIDGWQNTPAGERNRAPDDAPGQRMSTSDRRGPPAGSPSDRPRGGEPGSYNQYLSYQIRRHHADTHFFRHVPPTTWAVVHYRIARDGRLVSVELVKHSGDSEGAQRAVEVVRSAAPFEALPGTQARELDVVELFWTTGRAGPRLTPGSLENRLSQLPDGRRVEEIR